ncbi:MAG: cyclodeaminase/cyclohydrolase family protein [Actinomycetota bacterium]
MAARALRSVAALTVDKAGYEDVRGRMRAIAGEATEARGAFLDLADRDGDAFEAVMAAFALPKADDDAKARRAAAIQDALVGAAAVPLDTVRRAAPLLSLAEEALRTGNTNAASDALSGAELLAAGARSAAANVRINAASLRDRAHADALVAEVDGLLASVDATLAAIRAAFPGRVG